MMAESSVRPSAGGVARRRRERRLRSWWRHEQQTVRVALAAATHHSAQQNAAPRGAKTGARATEVEELRTSAGHRRLLHRRRGRASLRSPSRREVTATGGTSQGTASRPGPAGTCWSVGRGSGLLRAPLPQSPGAGGQEEGVGGGAAEEGDGGVGRALSHPGRPAHFDPAAADGRAPAVWCV